MTKAQLYVVGQFTLFAIMALALIIFPLEQIPLLRLVGFALIVVGFALILLAIREHAAKNATMPNITPTPNVRVGLIESGIYARIRHPIYTGVLSGALGVALVHGHFALLLIALVMIVFFTYKSRYEEELLRAVYPQYTAYMTRTGRFLPFPSIG